jgi:nitrous oxidase accessory protein NosD
MLTGVSKLSVLALGIGLALAGGRPAAAAVICVNPGGTGGCQSSIGAAVTAASAGDIIKVAAGTYKESVIIPKSLSLVGAGPATTIIDASGKSNGIYVDGIDWPHLSHVVITGFTVEQANFEGILVTNAADVTIYGNSVVSNDQALVITNGNAACSGLPAFETSEDDDCGEGIHLLGAEYSVVAANLVHGNAGGVLLSDDTAANHDNQVLSNTVSDNLSDCGITLASHPPATLTGAAKSLGVFHNKVASNTSTGNGTKAPGGAGTGIFASIPGAAAYGNVVVGNTLTGNGQTGVAMHSHTPGQTLFNNAIIGNTISGNGADTGDAATKGPVGINLYAVSPAIGTLITGNTISDEGYDIVINTPTPVAAHLNSLLGTGVGLDNAGAGSVDATLDWWGCAAGPGASGCSTASGKHITTDPYLQVAP